MGMDGEQERAGLVARLSIGPEEVTALWKGAEEIAPFAGHRVRLLEHVITVAQLVNISAVALLSEVRRLAVAL
jgi:hypothetical protein